MIRLNAYNADFEKEYYKAVSKYISKVQLKKEDIITSCKKYFPNDFFESRENDLENDFRTLILAPYSQLKKVYNHIKNNDSTMQKECFKIVPNAKEEPTKTFTDLYQAFYDIYAKVRNDTLEGTKMNVRMVNNLGVTVCPYCNRDYINCRGHSISGAELDHFYPRSSFPVFSISLYNLVPVCRNCNKTKSANEADLVSPFDQDIDFDSCLKISYLPIDDVKVKVTISSVNGLQNNISAMKIDKAYEINHIDIESLIAKRRNYNNSRIEELIDKYPGIRLSKSEIRTMVFGKEIEQTKFLKLPLSKLRNDILKELKVF